jgi:hypothetical protein
VSTIPTSARPAPFPPIYLQILPVRIVTSSAATKSVKTGSMRSNPAKTLIISELGFAYFLGRMEAKRAVAVFLCQPCPERSRPGLTSRACTSAGALPACMHVTALENSCRVCTYIGVNQDSSRPPSPHPHTWRCSKSSGLKPFKMRCSVTRSGFSRKNSLQKPSDFSLSSSSCWRISKSVLLSPPKCYAHLEQ